MRSGFVLEWVTDRVAATLLPALRADMAEQFEAEGRTLPAGQKWALRQDGQLLGLGGLEPAGHGRSLGWYLTGDLTPRQWAGVRSASRYVLHRAGTRGVRSVFAKVARDRPGHAAMLARLGFRLSGQEGDHAVMMKDLG
ncbi:MAG: hypothetical protein K2X61_04750 [Caulobacteraceae bacterium]|nr:hypothetical protein [Caulobacteraceae bacterium]